MDILEIPVLLIVVLQDGFLLFVLMDVVPINLVVLEIYTTCNGVGDVLAIVVGVQELNYGTGIC